MEHERSLGFYVRVSGGFLPAGSQYLGLRAATLSITYQALNLEGLSGKKFSSAIVSEVIAIPLISVILPRPPTPNILPQLPHESAPKSIGREKHHSPYNFQSSPIELSVSSRVTAFVVP